jgi:hypothetical protein
MGMLANFIRLGVEAHAANGSSAENGGRTSADAAAAAAVANGTAAKENRECAILYSAIQHL